MSTPLDRAIFDVWPRLGSRVPWTSLGEFPSPVERMTDLSRALDRPEAELWVKREDRSSPVYGGNKVRTLEALFGQALEKGARRIYATGAFGSNHAVATALHAPRVGLEPAAILFHQPASYAAVENFRVTLSTRLPFVATRHWSTFPLGLWAAQRRDKRDRVHGIIMAPGGATPVGALGYVSAALELAQQVKRSECPAPHTVLTAVGSTCTSAGLLVGFWAAARLGLGWTEPPRLVSVRVTPWPITSVYRISDLAARTSQLLAKLLDDPSFAFSRSQLASGLKVDNRYLGRGYGTPTQEGIEAIRLFEQHTGDLASGPLILDTTYSAKSGAAVLDRARQGLAGPLLYWATKSTFALPEVTESDWNWAPGHAAAWIRRAERACEPVR